MYPISVTGKTAFLEGQMQTATLTLEQGGGSPVAITNASILDMTIDRYSTAKGDLEIGCVSAAELTLELMNTAGEFDSVAWKNHEITVEITCGGVTVPMGTFIVDEAPKRQGKLTITALDRMILFDRYVDWTGYTFPMTAQSMVNAICTTCGVTLSTGCDLTTLPNYNYSISASPMVENLTWRQVLSWLCEIMGANAFMDWNGDLRLSWYAASGETFDDSVIISGEIAETGLTIPGVNIVIGGNEFLAGNAGNAITINGNMLIGANPQTIADNIYAAIGGLTYYPFTATVLPMSHLYPLDTITYVADATNHNAALTNVTFGLNYNTAFKGKGRVVADDDMADVGAFTSRQSAEINNINEAIEDTNNHFWADGDGIHVTYGTAVTGNNVLIDSDSLDIRDGTNVLATFGANTRIGEETGGHINLSSTGMEFLTDGGVSGGNIDMSSVTTESGNLRTAVISALAVNTNYTYSLRHIPVGPTVASPIVASVLFYPGGAAVVLSATILAPDTDVVGDGGNITARYISSNNQVRLKISDNTLAGERGDVVISGEYYVSNPKVQFGDRALATGANSFAANNGGASGIDSFAMGTDTIAAGQSQVAMGKYNVSDSTSKYALIIGNGISSSRSNAFTVDWDGDIEANRFQYYVASDFFATITAQAVLDFLNNTAVFQAGTNIITLLNASYYPRATIIASYSNAATSASAVCISMNTASTALWLWKPANGSWALYDSPALPNNASLLTSIATTEITSLTNGSPYAANGGCWYYKKGTRVHVHLAVTGLATNTSLALYTMPAGYRPISGSIIAGSAVSATSVCGCYINSSGVIYGFTARSNGVATFDLEYDAFA